MSFASVNSEQKFSEFQHLSQPNIQKKQHRFNSKKYQLVRDVGVVISGHAFTNSRLH